MKGVLYIDGIDVYASYGVSLSDISYDDLVCLPELKPVTNNDWHEKNGIEPDLSAPVIAAKAITISFNLIGKYSGYAAFMQAITNGAYHNFHFSTIGLTKDLRLVSCGDIDGIESLSSFSLTFSDDDPIKGYEYLQPLSKIEPLGDFLLDDLDIAQYGIRVLQGTMNSIKKSPAVKENLKRDVAVKNGIEYDSKAVTYKSKTVKLKCFMRAANAEEFWRNRNALLYNLTKPGERVLKVKELGKEIPFYYKSCDIGCFFPDKGKFWFEFTLNLEFFKGVI